MSRPDFELGMKLFTPIYRELDIPLPNYPKADAWGFDDQVAAMLEARPPVFSFVFGIPPQEIISECRERSIVTIAAATTVHEAMAAEAAGVDLVVATGFEAGGHRPSFLKPPETSLMGTLALVPQVVDCVSIPVIAAGGISDRRGVAAAFALGAQAVQLGTAFLACEESGASPLHRTSLFGQEARHTTLSRGFTGRLARFIRNRFLERVEAGEFPPLPFPIQSWFTGFIKKAAAEQKVSDYMSLYAGQGAPLLKHRNAADLMQSLIAEIDRMAPV
jgi:nitronate monooxygenase